MTLVGLLSEKTYGVAHSTMGKVSNLVNGPLLWNGPPRLEKFLNAFLSSGSKVVEWTPQDLTSGGNFGNSTFPCMVQ